MLNYLKELLTEQKRVKVFVTEEDLYEGLIRHVDDLGLVLDIGSFIVALPLSSVYVIEVEKNI